jgi:O-antigen/teichoic acid export membrane protein
MRLHSKMETKSSPPRHRLSLNSIYSLAAWLFPIILGFIATPILVRGLGNEQYGLLAIVLGFISYSFTFGIGKIAAKYISEYGVSGESQKISESLSATIWFSLAIGLIGSVTLAILAPTLVSNVLLIGPELHDKAVLALTLAAVIGLVTMLSQIFQYALQGLHRFDRYVVITNLNSLILSGGNILLVWLGYGVAALLVWNLFVVIITGTLFCVSASRMLPDFRPRFSIGRETLVSVVKYGGNIILYQIFANALFIFERSLVVRRFGAEAMTFYFVPMLLAIYMHGIIASFVQALFPVVNELLEEREKLIRLYQRATRYVLALVVLIATTLITTGHLFLELWISPAIAQNSSRLLVIHVLTYALIAIGVISLQVAESFRFSSFYTITSAFWFLVAVPLMIILADNYRSEGIATARLIATALSFPLLFYIERRFLGRILWRFWVATFLKIGVAAIMTAFAEFFILNLLAPSWFAFLLAGSTGVAIFGASLLILRFFSDDEWAMLRGLLRSQRSLGIGSNTVE